MTLTVADVLALPVLAAALPTVVTGHSRLDAPVRWVHVTELTDPASFLKGGELVLTTGVPLPAEPVQVRRYVDELADVGAAGLVIELIRRYRRAPDELIAACQARDLPLITLSEDVNFVDITQVVHALLLGNQAEVMRRTQRVHERFTMLTLRGADPEEVLADAARLVGRPVVLENLAHQALICAPAGEDVADVLADWERRSRATPAADRPATHGPEHWLVAPVEYRGDRWGRVAMLAGPSPSAEAVTVLERTAMALTIARLTHPTTWERTAHRGILTDLADRRPGAVARARALGLPATGGFVAALVDLDAEWEERLAAELTGIPALIGVVDNRIGVVLAITRDWESTIDRIANSLDAIVSIGSEVDDLADVARSFREAARIAEAILPGAAKTLHRLSDLGLRELLHALRDDVRVQHYPEIHIGPILDYDARHGTDLLATLRHYLDVAGNKTTAARRSGLSRQTLYHRLATIERLLGRDLESGKDRLELHVALTALDVLRMTRP